MTRHSLGYLLSERAKAQKQFVVPPVIQQETSQQQEASDQDLLTNDNNQQAIAAGSDGAVVNRDATPEDTDQVSALQHEAHPTQQ